MNTTDGTNQPNDLFEQILTKIETKISDRRYCDTGPHAGMWRVRVGQIYLTNDELKAVSQLGRRHGDQCVFITSVGKELCDCG